MAIVTTESWLMQRPDVSSAWPEMTATSKSGHEAKAFGAAENEHAA